VSTVFRVCAVICLLAGVLCEVRRVLAAPGVSFVLGLCLATYLWFLAAARDATRMPPRRLG
jgi:hypothetical protein